VADGKQVGRIVAAKSTIWLSVWLLGKQAGDSRADWPAGKPLLGLVAPTFRCRANPGLHVTCPALVLHNRRRRGRGKYRRPRPTADAPGRGKAIESTGARRRRRRPTHSSIPSMEHPIRGSNARDGEEQRAATRNSIERPGRLTGLPGRRMTGVGNSPRRRGKISPPGAAAL